MTPHALFDTGPIISNTILLKILLIFNLKYFWTFFFINKTQKQTVDFLSGYVNNRLNKSKSGPKKIMSSEI